MTRSIVKCPLTPQNQGVLATVLSTETDPQDSGSEGSGQDLKVIHSLKKGYKSQDLVRLAMLIGT